MLQVIDGMDKYNTAADITMRGGAVGAWTAQLSGAFTPTYASTGGRFNGGRMQVSSNGGGESWLKYIAGVSDRTFFFGASIKISVSFPYNSKSFYFSSVTGEECGIRLNTDGSVSAMRGATLLGTSAATGVILLNTWQRIEIMVKSNTWTTNVANADGAITVRVNNATVLDLQNIVTMQNLNAASYTAATISCASSGFAVLLVDDVTIVTGTGGAQTSWLGDLKVDTLAVTGDVGPNNGTPSTAGAHYLMVNDAGGYNTTNYVDLANTSGQEERFSLADLSVGATTIYGVQVVSVCQKTDASSAIGLIGVEQSGATKYGTAFALNTGSWTMVGAILETDAANASWTASTVNSANFSYKVQ